MNDPELAVAHEIDLAHRFSVDREKAREWLGRIVAAYPHEAEDISADAPTISATWHSRSVGAEWTSERLVRGAVEDGILICPDGMDVSFVHEPDSDGGTYHFAVDIGRDVATQVNLTTWGYEMRKVGHPNATGIEAALSILDEAESLSNQALARLALLAAAQSGQGRPPAGADELHQAEVDRLTDLATSLGVSEPDLDDYVHDLASTPASDINNGGLAEQIAYMIRQGGSAGTEAMIREAAGEPEHESERPEPNPGLAGGHDFPSAPAITQGASARRRPAGAGIVPSAGQTRPGTSR
jgi:hypothetical protein